MTVVVPETDALFSGAVSAAVTGDVPPPPVVFSDVVNVSNVDEPSVHARPIWPVLSLL